MPAEELRTLPWKSRVSYWTTGFLGVRCIVSRLLAAVANVGTPSFSEVYKGAKGDVSSVRELTKVTRLERGVLKLGFGSFTSCFSP